MSSQFGELLAKHRQEKKLTVRKLAEKLNYSPSQISEIETGRRLPPKDNELLSRIASILGIDAVDFIKKAKEGRLKKDSFLFRKVSHDLAWGFYRIADDVDKASLEEAVKKMIEDLTERKKMKEE